MVVDFHVHSTASDGTLSPREIAERGKDFAALALTDHDNCDGVDEFLAAPLEGSPLRRFSGIELSIEPGEGFHKFHLLGLGVDPTNEGLRAFLRRVLEGRNERNERIRANFARLGIEIAAEDIATYAHGEILARPHFARWLVLHGYAPDVKTAFERYLAPTSPAETSCYEDRWHPSQEDAIRIVHEAGGLAIMAHPKYWNKRWKYFGVDFEIAEYGLAQLKEVGLDGVESIYQANTRRENVEFTRIALKLGYLTSAGSDFHGDNKPSIHVGMEVDEAFIRPLLDRLSCAAKSDGHPPIAV